MRPVADILSDSIIRVGRTRISGIRDEPVVLELRSEDHTGVSLSLEMFSYVIPEKARMTVI